MNTTPVKQRSPSSSDSPFWSQARNRLLVAFLLVLTVQMIAMEAVRRWNARNLLVRQAIGQREAIRDIKATQVEDFFADFSDQVRAFSNSPRTREAMRELSRTLVTARTENAASQLELRKLRFSVRAFYDEAFTRIYKERNDQKLPPLDDLLSGWDDDSVYLQHLYVQNNPHPLNTNEALERADDKSTYSTAHAKYHPEIRQFLQKCSAGNILLCDATGRVVYSARKSLNFASSLRSPHWAATNLGVAFRRAATATSENDVVIGSFACETARYEDVTGFVVSPVFEGTNRIGFAVFQLPIEHVNRIVTEPTELRETAETYVVGADKRFRSDSRFLQQLQVPTTIMNADLLADTAATRDALAGETSAGIIEGYRRTATVSAWRPITIADAGSSEPLNWALVSEISLNEVKAPLRSASFWASGAIPLVLSLIVAVGVVIFLTKPWTVQAENITKTLDRIAAGERSARAEVVTKDEFGAVAKSLNEWLATEDAAAPPTLWHAARVSATPETGVDASELLPGERSQQIMLDVQNTTIELSRFAEQIQTATESLSIENSAQLSQIDDTSSAIDEMVESIHHVAESSATSAKVAVEARQSATNGSQAVLNTIKGMDRIRSQVQSTAKRIKRLGESSQEIGEIVQLISDVADRTSILALNASVQAAMAGDAGHGFEVVAEEVDRLSKRCNDATKRIAQLVKCIQSETSEAIIGMEESTVEVVEGSKLASQAGESLAEIDSVSNRLAELIDSVSFAAKQQARSGLLVSRSIKEVSSVMHITASGTNQTAKTVHDLAARADALRLAIRQLTAPVPQTAVASTVNVPNANAAGQQAAPGTVGLGTVDTMQDAPC